MTAVDTNVVVRLLTRDGAGQSAAASSLFSSGSIWIAKSVLLETAWVLRSHYGFDERAICDAFQKLLGLGNVQAEDSASVILALELAGQGIDIADAFHLASRPSGAAFATFDKALIRGARRAGVAGVRDVTLRLDAAR